MVHEKLTFWRNLGITTLVALALDQLTKLWVLSTLALHEVKTLVGSLLRVSLTHNTRGIFGLPLGPRVTYYLLPLAGIGLVIYFAFRSKGLLSALSFGLILAGALGNLIDRIRLGNKVVDFIDMGVGNVRWYTYNLADFFIVAGIVLLLIKEAKREKEKRDEKDLSRL